MSKIKPKSNYDFPIKTIHDLSEITYTPASATHYQFIKNTNPNEQFDFLYKRNNDPPNKTLTVLFHGRVPKNSYPIFRGYNYELENSDILSLSDRLQKETNLEVCFFLHYIEQYIEIIDAIKTQGNYDNILFFASSGGGYIALFMASYFHQYAFTANGFYYDHSEHYRRLKAKVQNKNNQNNQNYFIGMDIEKVFEHFTLPKHISLFSNECDSIHPKQTQRLLEYIKTIQQDHLDKVETTLFKKKVKGEDPHIFNVPEKTTQYWIQHFINININK